jgi:hypothetical protein
MKRLLIFLCALPLLAACASSAPVEEQPVAVPVPAPAAPAPTSSFAAAEILALFQQYLDLYESPRKGRAFLLRFQNETSSALQALVMASPFQREQMLVLIGSTIAGARRTDPAAYSQYSAALQSLESLDLDEDSRQMLRFIHANIAYFDR